MNSTWQRFRRPAYEHALRVQLLPGDGISITVKTLERPSLRDLPSNGDFSAKLEVQMLEMTLRQYGSKGFAAEQKDGQCRYCNWAEAIAYQKRIEP